METQERERYWILENGVPITVDMLTWALQFNSTERTIRQHFVGRKTFVSTVFLGLNHNFYDSGPPLLFESMVFGGKLTDTQLRYPTTAAAIVGHYGLVIDAIAADKVPAGQARVVTDSMNDRVRIALRFRPRGRSRSHAELRRRIKQRRGELDANR